MGTRADFYVGIGEDAEWLGSVAWDGYPDGFEMSLMEAETEQDYRAWVADLASRDDFTAPGMGWPWPWDDSGTTDYAYFFIGGTVHGSHFGGPLFIAADGEPDYDASDGKHPVMPKMRTERSAEPGSSRSGVIAVTF